MKTKQQKQHEALLRLEKAIKIAEKNNHTWCLQRMKLEAERLRDLKGVVI